MQTVKNHERLAQSASALGAGLLGFGMGSLWGGGMGNAILITTLVIGGMIHVAGMYVLQIRNTGKAGGIAKILWLTAWLCLLSLIAIFIYLAVK